MESEAASENSQDDSHFSSMDLSRSDDSPWRASPRTAAAVKAKEEEAAAREEKRQAKNLEYQQGIYQPPDSPQQETFSKQLFPDSPPDPSMIQNVPVDNERDLFLAEFYTENREKVEEYSKLCQDLVYIMARDMPDVKITEDYSPRIITAMITHYINELKTRFKRYKLEIGDMQMGTEKTSKADIRSKIEVHKKSVFELLDTYEKDLAKTREENLQLKVHVEHLEANTDYLETKIHYLERGTMYQGQLVDSFMGDELEKDKIMADLQGRNAYAERLNSTLRDELNETIDAATEAQRQMELLKKKLSTIEEEALEDLSSLAQKVEVTSLIEEALMSMMQDKISEKEPNIEDCRNIVKEWIRLMTEAMEGEGQKLNDILTECNNVKSQVSEREAELQNLKERSEEVNHEVSVLNESLRLKKENAKLLTESIENVARQIKISSRYSEDLNKLYEKQKGRYDRRLHDTASTDMEDYSFESSDRSFEPPHRSLELPDRSFETPDRSLETTDRSFEYQGRAEKSSPDSIPDAYSSYRTFESKGFDGSLASTSQGAVKTTLDVGSGMDVQFSSKGLPSPLKQEITFVSDAPGKENTRMMNAPFQINQRATIPMRTPSPKSSPPDSTSSGAVKTTLDVGSGMNVTLSSKRLPSPLRQELRVISDAPGKGKTRMVDAPFQINQRATIPVKTPSPETPYIPPSRFGYTDPKAVRLNIPPGGRFIFDSVKKSIVVPRSDQENPLKVDIDVQPHPLLQSKSGEHFVCDISVNMEEISNKPNFDYRQLNFIPVYYKTPPIVDEKHEERKPWGLFTPRGIFKRRHYAVRNLFEDDYESPGSPWGTGRKYHSEDEIFPYELDSPVKTDHSMEWEKPKQYPYSMSSTHPSVIPPRNWAYTSSSTSPSPQPVIQTQQERYVSSKSTLSPEPVIPPRHIRYGHSSPSPSPEPVIKPRYGMYSSSSPSPSPEPVIKPRYGMYSSSSPSPSPEPVIKPRYGMYSSSSPSPSPEPVIKPRYGTYSSSSPSPSPEPVIKPRYGTYSSSSPSPSPEPIIKSRYGMCMTSSPSPTPEPVIQPRYGMYTSSSPLSLPQPVIPSRYRNY